jgi:1-deoxy-D-xylulose-5-phosphate synthase
MPSGTGLDRFAERFPDRFYDVGIAEEHAVGLAAGLAVGGRLPVVAIYSTFLQRAYDQLMMDVALQGLHVVFCIDRAGLVGEDGATHHGVFDLTYLRSVPGLIVLAPADEFELAEALHAALAASGPVAIRYPRGAGTGVKPAESSRVSWTEPRAQIRRTGSTVALIGVGRMVAVCGEAASALDADGIDASVINARWVKPLDQEMVLQAAATHSLLVTVEESSECGGFGAGVMECLSVHGVAAPVLRLAVPDRFVTHGAMSNLLQEIGLTSEGVREAVIDRLRGDNT